MSEWIILTTVRHVAYDDVKILAISSTSEHQSAVPIMCIRNKMAEREPSYLFYVFVLGPIFTSRGQQTAGDPGYDFFVNEFGGMTRANTLPRSVEFELFGEYGFGNARIEALSGQLPHEVEILFRLTGLEEIRLVCDETAVK